MAYAIGLESKSKNVLSNIKKLGNTDPTSFQNTINTPSQDELLTMSNKYLGFDIRTIWNPDNDLETNLNNMEQLNIDEFDIPDFSSPDIEFQDIITDYGKLMGADLSPKDNHYGNDIITGLPSLDAINIQRDSQLNELIERGVDSSIKNLMYGTSWVDLSSEQPNKVLDLIQSTGRSTKEGAILSSSYFNDVMKTKDVFGAPFDEIRENINSEADIGTPEYMFKNIYNRYFQDKNLSETLEAFHDASQNRITGRPNAYQSRFNSPSEYASNYDNIESVIKPVENAATSVTPDIFGYDSSINLDNIKSLGDKPIAQAITENDFMLSPDTSMLDNVSNTISSQIESNGEPQMDEFTKNLILANNVNIKALTDSKDIPNGFQMLTDGLSSSFFSSNVNIIQNDSGNGMASILADTLRKIQIPDLFLTIL